MTINDYQTLALWFSPNFPTGGFAFSHGLDHMIAAQTLASLDDLKAVLESLLIHGGAKNDAIFLALSYKGEDVAALCKAFTTGAERLEETMTQGENFVRAANKTHDLSLTSAPYPIAVGQAARALSLDLEITIAYYLQAFISNLAMIAQRLVPFGANDVQKIIASLAPLITQTTKQAMSATRDDLSNACLMIDLASMHHETQGVRLCKT